MKETESGREESGQRMRSTLPSDQEMESVAARKPTRPKRRQAVEKAGVERRQQKRGATGGGRRGEDLRRARHGFGKLAGCCRVGRVDGELRVKVFLCHVVALMGPI
ncbi:hypothetical protein OsI_28920 [Oryza sativa Indica Group]|uniref:Uncharacterized protein n=1 Tax=Oryza sativa subsp. indica TaxID=39946 RepID=A2YUB0_ORYSI|nr:hypothetical protein OsI_28920 [Oryza sativa Indica Group]